jgi:hypothetical protein
MGVVKMNTVQLYDNVPMEGKEFEVLESRGVEKALRQCQDEKYDALFVPQLADARIAASGDSRVWNTWYSTPSLRATGRTKGNKPVVVYAHVPNYFSKPTNIAKAVDDGLVKYAGRMPPKEFQMLLDLEDNENVFVVDYDKLKNSSSGVIDVAQALKHPQTIPFLGGQTRAEQYLQRHREVRGNTIGIWHYDDLADKPLGRLLFLGYYDGALFGYIGLYDYGRFVGVAPEARASRKKSGPYREPGMVQGPSLDDLLALAEEHVSPAGKPGYEEAVRKLFGK